MKHTDNKNTYQLYPANGEDETNQTWFAGIFCSDFFKLRLMVLYPASVRQYPASSLLS